MPSLRTKQEMANLAQAFATTHDIVYHAGSLYMPVHFLDSTPQPTSAQETVWTPLSDKKLLAIANLLLRILFPSDAEYRSFKLMVRQFSQNIEEASGLLVRYKTDQVKLLTGDGKLVEPTGDFVPNYLNVPYDPDNELNAVFYDTLKEWLDSDEQAKSLLHHLATALQSSWSAVRYVLLIGKGRNGKGTLLKMIYDLFGEANISKVSRLDMTSKSPIITTLNAKLLNVVFDGPKDFLKDSSTEKTLIAGEPIDIEMKYENAPFTVQTNALFVEALNSEPRTGDKSEALQKRLVRFRFPKVYALDHGFEEKMRSEKMLAAFLHNLLEHWVMKDEVAEKLQVTAESLDMQLEAVWSGSPLLRFLEYVSGRDDKFLPNIIAKKMTTDTFISVYRDWLESNGYKHTEDDYLMLQLREHFELDRKSFWNPSLKKNRSMRYIKAVFPDTMNAINILLEGGSLQDSDSEETDVLSEK